MSRALMIQGAGSDVGKSLIVAGLAPAADARELACVCACCFCACVGCWTLLQLPLLYF